MNAANIDHNSCFGKALDSIAKKREADRSAAILKEETAIKDDIKLGFIRVKALESMSKQHIQKMKDLNMSSSKIQRKEIGYHMMMNEFSIANLESKPIELTHQNRDKKIKP